MPFMKESSNLYDFDIYPKVVPAGKSVCITIRSLGAREAFHPRCTYTVTVKGIDGGKQQYYPIFSEYESFDVKVHVDGTISFDYTFQKEQEYFIDIPYVNHREQQIKERFCIYCIEGDLIGKYPFIGDLHIHTTYSDGAQTPGVVCANYRRNGYDFICVTDHRRYYPSLEVMRQFNSLPTEMTILPGEEVHMPKSMGYYIDPHIVNVGGEYSINALVERDDVDNIPIDPSNRSLFGNCPDIINQAEFDREIQKIISELDIPDGVDPIPAAGMKWVCDHVREAGGLSVFPHPTWINDVFHVPEKLHRLAVEKQFFDAFEVLGGENYYEQNGFQTVDYYDDMAKGYHYPIVGSTDSHNSTPLNRNALICSTIVFTEKNVRKCILNAIKNDYSVAVDTINKEFRLVGSKRLVRYACFLLRNYFPLHDEVCYEEGRMLFNYLTGTDEEKEDALSTLKTIFGRVQKMQKKYFAF